MNKSILENIENAIFFGEEGRDDAVSSTLFLETIKLELEIKRELECSGMASGIAKKYLPVLNKYKHRTDWSLNETNEEYLKRIKKDVYVYYCIMGLEELIRSGGKMDFSESELHDRYYELLGKIMHYYRYLPDRIDSIVFEEIHFFKACVSYSIFDSDIEPMLFLLGLWKDIRIMMKEKMMNKNMKQKTRKRQRSVLGLHKCHTHRV